MSSGAFANQIAWVTGASAGIGRAVALELARRGARVAVSARRTERLADVVREIEALGTEGLAVECDVTQEPMVKGAVEQVVERFGRLDVTVANAGFAVAGRIENLSADDWRRQLDVNVVGLAMTARYALPYLRETHGRLVLVGSVTSMLPTAKTGAYAASKYAVRAIGQTLALELHGTGVTCTTVHPGYVESEIAQIDNEGRYDPTRKDKRPARLMWPTDKAARALVDAVERRKREHVFTGHGKIGAFAGRHWPGLVHFAMTRR